MLKPDTCDVMEKRLHAEPPPGVWTPTSPPHLPAAGICSVVFRRSKPWCFQIQKRSIHLGEIKLTHASSCPFSTTYAMMTSSCCHANSLPGVGWEIMWILTHRRTGGSLWELSVIRVGDDEAVCIAASRLCLCSPAGERAQWRDDWYCFLLSENEQHRARWPLTLCG